MKGFGDYTFTYDGVQVAVQLVRSEIPDAINYLLPTSDAVIFLTATESFSEPITALDY